MPIQLTLPFDPGSLDPGKSYTHVDISEFALNRPGEFIRIIIRRGYLEDTEFVAGDAATFPPLVFIKNKPKQGTTDYTDLTQALPVSGQIPIYDNAGFSLYGWMLDNGYPGTIVV